LLCWIRSASGKLFSHKQTKQTFSANTPFLSHAPHKSMKIMLLVSGGLDWNHFFFSMAIIIVIINIFKIQKLKS
jgi:hypothetical protein